MLSKFLAFYEAPKSITVVKGPWHLILPLKQVHHIHTLTLYFCYAFNITVLFLYKDSNWSLPFRFHSKTFLSIAYLSRVLLSLSINSPSFYGPL
jgi:hypothetical protein